MVDFALYLSYILIIGCAVIAIIMPLIQSFSDPQSLTKSGIGVAGLVVVFIIAYAVADNSSMGTTESTSKIVGAGIISTYVFFAIATVGIVFTEISKFLK